jgi:hypothetical protein
MVNMNGDLRSALTRRQMIRWEPKRFGLFRFRAR